MVKTVVVAVCDICGKTEYARVIGTWHNEPMYGVPEGWTSAEGNKDVHLCPFCARKLKAGLRNG